MAHWGSTQQFVVVTVNEQALICVSFSGQYPALILQSYQKIVLEPGVIQNLLLCNPTKIMQHITNFLIQNHLCLAQIGLILIGDQLVETLTTEQMLDYRLLQISLLSIANQSGQVQENHYRAGLLAGILLQYQLAFVRERLNLVGITSKNGALLGLTNWADFICTGELPNLVSGTAQLLFGRFKVGTQHMFTVLEQQELLPSVGLYLNWSQNEAS